MELLKIAIVGALFILFVRVGAQKDEKLWKNILSALFSIACFTAGVWLSIQWITPMFLIFE